MQGLPYTHAVSIATQLQPCFGFGATSERPNATDPPLGYTYFPNDASAMYVVQLVGGVRTWVTIAAGSVPPASAIPFTPVAPITATNVQDAIVQVLTLSEAYTDAQVATRLAVVSHDATLTGSGTSGSQLAVNTGVIATQAFANAGDAATLVSAEAYTDAQVATKAPNNAPYLISGAAPSLSAAINIQSMASSLGFTVVATPNNGNVDVFTLTHNPSGGAAANGIAAGILFRSQDNAGIAQDVARIYGVFTNAANGSVASGIGLMTRTGGGALSDTFRFGSDAGLLINPTSTTLSAGLGAGGVGLRFQDAIYSRNATDNGWITLATFNASSQAVFGATAAAATRLLGSVVQVFSTGPIRSFVSSTQCAEMNSTTLAWWGTGEASATPGSYTHRGANATGSNIAAGTLTYQAPLSTGNAAPGVFQIQGGQAVASGSGQHTVVILAQFINSDTDGDTALLLRVRSGGVSSLQRATLVAGASVAGSGRNFLSVP